MSTKKLSSLVSNTNFKLLLLGMSLVTGVSGQDDVATKYITPPMVNISAGSFKMGTESGDALAKPMHSVTLPAFQMGKYPVQ